MNRKPTDRLPQDWKWVQLGDCIYEIKRSNTLNEDFPVFSVTKDKGLILQAEKYGKRIASDDTSRYKIVKRGEFAYDPMSLYYGAIGRQKRLPVGIISPAYVCFSCKENILPEYLDYVLKDLRVMHDFNQSSYGGNSNGKRKKIDWESFGKVYIPLPPLSVQRWIAGALADVDEWLEISETSCSIGKNALRLLIQQLTMPSSESEEGWTSRRLCEICNVESGTTPSRRMVGYFAANGTPWVKTTDLNEDWIENTEECLTDIGIKAYKKPLFSPNSVLLAMYGGFNQIGRTAILRRLSATNQALSVLENLTVNPRYVLYNLQANIQYWRRIAASSRKDANITKRDVENYRISFPLEATAQEEIVRRIDDLKAQNALAEMQLPELKRLKQALLQQLLSGTLQPVGGWAAVISELAHGEAL